MAKIGGKTVTKDTETPKLTVDQIIVHFIENYGRTRASYRFHSFTLVGNECGEDERDGKKAVLGPLRSTGVTLHLLL